MNDGPSGSGGGRALVVDDEPDLRSDLVACTQEALVGWTVVEAGTAAEARSLLSQGQYDILVVDLRLNDAFTGVFTGLKLAQEAKSSRPEIQVVCVSSHLDLFALNQSASDLYRYGFEYLARPWCTSPGLSFEKILTVLLQRFAANSRLDRRIESVAQLWSLQRETQVSSYWVMLLAEFDSPTETSAVGSLLSWQRLQAPVESRVEVLTRSDGHFGVVSADLGVIECPELVVGSTSEMLNRIHFLRAALERLAAQEILLRRLLVALHVQLKQGDTIEDIYKRLSQPLALRQLGFEEEVASIIRDNMRLRPPCFG